MLSQVTSFIQDMIVRRSLVPVRLLPTGDDLASRLQRVDVALKNLRRTSGRRRNIALLPRILMIGKHASVKTPLIDACTQYSHVIPLAETEKGTKNCNWYISERSMILDTAGRYVEPQNAEQDHGEWLALLQYLRRSAYKVPLHGVVVTVSADDIVTRTDGELQGDADLLRARIHEVIEMLGCDVPVYTIITKSDLMRGFSSFMGALSDQHLRQVFGYVDDPPVSDRSQRGQAAAERLISGVNAIDGRLHCQRLSLLFKDTREELYQPLFCFPEEFSLFRQRLAVFIAALCREQVRFHLPLVRGIFFMSTKQEGTELSFVKRQFGLPEGEPQQEAHRAFFVDDFFDVILPNDRHLSKLTTSTTRRKRIKQSLMLIGGVGLALVTPPLFRELLAKPAEVPKSPVGSLQLQSRQDGVAVTIDGQVYGQAGMSAALFTQLPVGKHRVVATKEGYLRWERTITIDPSQEKVVELNLQPISGPVGEGHPPIPEPKPEFISPGLYETVRSTPIFEGPSRKAPRRETIRPGVRLVVVGKKGKFVEVEPLYHPPGPEGPVYVLRKDVRKADARLGGRSRRRQYADASLRRR